MTTIKPIYGKNLKTNMGIIENIFKIINKIVIK